MARAFVANTHTVRLFLCVPTPLLSGDGWVWGPHPDTPEIGRDFAYNSAELVAVFRAWGPIVARLLVGERWEGFNLSAYGAVSGNLLGRDTWWLDAHTGALEPHGEPWALFEAQARVPDDMGPMLPR
jgi:hypothetical protein